MSTSFPDRLLCRDKGGRSCEVGHNVTGGGEIKSSQRAMEIGVHAVNVCECVRDLHTVVNC